MALTPTQEAQVIALIAEEAALLSLADNEASIISNLGATDVSLSDLAAASAVADADLLLIRQGATDKSVTPLLLVPDASTTVAGKIELATNGETISGASGARAVTPAGLKALLDDHIYSGTWTPTLTNVTNIASSTASVCQYMRLGDVVQFSGTVAVDPTAVGVVELSISLPVAFNFTDIHQVSGTCVDTSYSQLGQLTADTAADDIRLKFNATDATIRTWKFGGSYRMV